MPRKKFVKKVEGTAMTLEEHCAHDDICTDLLIDHTGYHTQIRKCKDKYQAMRGIGDADVVQILQRDVMKDLDVFKATEALLHLNPVKRYADGLDTTTERDRFRTHVMLYAQIYAPDCPWEVTSTNRYSIGTFEAAVTARCVIEPGPVARLTGTTLVLNDAESKTVDNAGCGLSVMVSAKTQAVCVMLGPARLVNHDCCPNAALEPTSTGVQVVARRRIGLDEEITVSYGGHYFGTDNADCLCASCENLVRGGWRKALVRVTPPLVPQYIDSTRIPSEYSHVRHVLSAAQHVSSPHRQPADYVLTKKLLVGQYDRWVRCRNDGCGHNFVQQDGYDLRWECCRCERHRMLFRMPWPRSAQDLEDTEESLGHASDASIVTEPMQGRCGKGRWVSMDADSSDGKVTPGATRLFVPAADRRQITRQGLQMEADLARLKGQDVGLKFTGGSQVGLRRSKRPASRLVDLSATT